MEMDMQVDDHDQVENEIEDLELKISFNNWMKILRVEVPIDVR